jgi:glycosyltransferase involved in cell wall biosynthesis
MSRLVISVIVSTHNRRDLVKEAIDSVLGQEPSTADLELVVVDDNSSDDTAEVVGRYPQAKYVRVKEGTPAGTRNAGIAHATGTWLAFLDDDDAWLPQKVKSFVRAMKESPDARVIFSAAYICDHLLRPGPIWPGPVHLSGDRLYDSVLSEAITPSVFMVHRDVFAKVGHFDPGVFRAEPRTAISWRAPLAQAFGSRVSRRPSSSIADVRSSTATSSPSLSRPP